MTKSVKLLLWLITKFDPSKFNYKIDNIYAMGIGQVHYLHDVYAIITMMLERCLVLPWKGQSPQQIFK
jgi:hypothetical protein